MTEEEIKKCMDSIQDILLDLQLDGKVELEEITTTTEEDKTITRISMQPIFNSDEEKATFMEKAMSLGYITEKVESAAEAVERS
jgi:bacterioferritin (cytochrome b1)